MVKRVHIAPDRLLLSRPGFAAAPGMPHASKAYDSDWAYAGQKIASGWENDPAPPYSTTALNGTQGTTDSSPWVISFPACSFIPTVTLGVFYSPDYILHTSDGGQRATGLQPLYWQYIQIGTQPPYNSQPRFTFEVTNQSIIITRRPLNALWYRFRYALYYEVFGFAG